MKWLHFILSHSIFISFCAAGMCFQTYCLLHLQHDPYIYSFVFCATLGGYNFYWLISKYSFSHGVRPGVFLRANKTYLILFFLAGAGMLASLSFLHGYYYYISTAIALTLLYSLPLWPFRFVAFTRRAGFLKTILLAGTWAWVTVAVPAAPILKSSSFFLPEGVLFFTRFCFILMLCILFDLRDMKIDKMHSLHSLATDVSKRSMRLIMLTVFIIYMLGGTFVRIYFIDIRQFMAFLFTGLLVWIVYRLSLQKERGYLFYYFLVDGLMLISAAATYIASI